MGSIDYLRTWNYLGIQFNWFFAKIYIVAVSLTKLFYNKAKKLFWPKSLCKHSFYSSAIIFRGDFMHTLSTLLHVQTASHLIISQERCKQ